MPPGRTHKAPAETEERRNAQASREALAVTVAMATAAAMTAAGVAYASIPDSTTGMISSCYNTTSGAVRVIDDSSYGPTRPVRPPRSCSCETRSSAPARQACPDRRALPARTTCTGSGPTCPATPSAKATPAPSCTTAPPTRTSRSRTSIRRGARSRSRRLTRCSGGPITTSYQPYGAYVYANFAKGEISSNTSDLLLSRFRDAAEIGGWSCTTSRRQSHPMTTVAATRGSFAHAKR
jgi:hypothetical protein